MLLERQQGRLTTLGMMAILRDHGEGAEANPHWHPVDTVGRTICMHAAAGPRLGQTTGSMVSELRDGGGLHWMTGTAAPCTSIFKPVVLAAGLPWPTTRLRTSSTASLWWRHEFSPIRAEGLSASPRDHQGRARRTGARRIDPRLRPEPGTGSLADMLDAARVTMSVRHSPRACSGRHARRAESPAVPAVSDLRARAAHYLFAGCPTHRPAAHLTEFAPHGAQSIRAPDRSCTLSWK
jgi:hypothetical protein